MLYFKFPCLFPDLVLHHLLIHLCPCHLWFRDLLSELLVLYLTVELVADP